MSHEHSIDHGQYSKAWFASSKASQKDYDETAFVSVFDTQRKPLGGVVTRAPYGLQAFTALPTGQKGNFHLYTYRTAFSSGQKHLEGISLTTEDSKWKVLNHNIASVPK